MLKLFNRRKFLVVKAFRLHDEELSMLQPRLRELLGFLIFQAMNDGMFRIHLGLDAATKEPYLRYFGPVFYEEEKRIWWEMVPLPSRLYPRMWQICISLVRLSDDFPPRGVIPALRGRKKLDLDFSFPDMHSFEIAWDARYAEVRRRSHQSGGEMSLGETQ